VKLESGQEAALKHRYKVVRRDDYTDVPGEIDNADDETGECSMLVSGPGGTETKSYSFGPQGIRIVGRRR
jgi:hypothetical protein